MAAAGRVAARAPVLLSSPGGRRLAVGPVGRTTGPAEAPGKLSVFLFLFLFSIFLTFVWI